MSLAPSSVTLFLSGDVMTGRGIDQVLPHPSPPRLYERYVADALDYVRLAEMASGSISRPVSYGYVWGDALQELERRSPDLRIINLETSVTSHGVPEWKGINYRMHPRNMPCLVAAHVSCCVLANNHVLDWGETGLLQTLQSVHDAGIATAGAGRDLREAEAPASWEFEGGRRVRVCAFATESSGVPRHWAAGARQPGICVLADLSERSLERVRSILQREERPNEIKLVSVHWGGNWGYAIPEVDRRFAHDLIDRAGADIVYGHSSHHPKGIEVYRGKPILYGCGDLINDYEGIGGHERYRAELGLMYFVTMDAAQRELASLELVAMRRRRFSLEHAPSEDAAWLSTRLDEEGRRLGTRIRRRADRVLELCW
jgi:poly-gamma-glutamate synthesis protein (capsule biosynthesis protein)